MFPVRQLNRDRILHGSSFIRDDVAGENRMCNGLATANCHITEYISRLAQHRQWLVCAGVRSRFERYIPTFESRVDHVC